KFLNKGYFVKWAGPPSNITVPFEDRSGERIRENKGTRFNFTKLKTIPVQGKIELWGATIQVADTLDLEGGALLGSTDVLGNLVHAGEVAPGFQGFPGLLSISPSPTSLPLTNGYYDQTAAGVLDMDIGGYSPGTGFDQVDATGVAFLDGELNVNLINGFIPVVGDSFVIMNYADSIGEFET